MRSFSFFRLILTTMLLGMASAHAAEVVDRIAAVVNDEIITVRELDERVRMAIILSQLQDNVEVRKRVVPQVLRKMIDEHLIMQDAKRYKISTMAPEVDGNIHMVEKQNNIPEGALVKELGRFNIPAAALREQFAADITWQKLTSGMFLPNLKVGDEEVGERLSTIAAQLGKPEYMVAEIFLEVENAAQDDQARNLGDRLIEQLKEGAPFPVLASQFSQAPSASNGGNMGWVSEGSMDDDLFAVVKEMTPGSVTKLLRTGDGYHIMALVSRRIAGTGGPGSDSTLTYATMVLPVPAKDAPPRNVLASKAMQLMRGLKTCDEFEAMGRKEAATGMGRTGPVKLAALAPDLQGLLQNVQAGDPTLPSEAPQGLRMMMVCSRNDTLAPLPSVDVVRRQIEDERMSMMSRRYMRDLHRVAFIDTRL